METSQVYIIILNYKGWEDTIECLESVLRLNYPQFKVIVVDNYSPNESVERMRQWAEGQLCVWHGRNHPLKRLFATSLLKPVPYRFLTAAAWQHHIPIITDEPLFIVQAGSNDGFAAGNNLVIRHLLTLDAYIWLLNPDMVVEPDSLSQLVRFTESLPHKPVVGALIKDYLQPDQTLIYGGGQHRPWSGTITFLQNKHDLHRLDYVHGGSFFTHLSNFKKMGPLPEEYFLYGEESDWCHRAKQSGIQLTVCDAAICYDKVSTSIGKGFLAEYYYTRNALKFYQKYCPIYVPFILASNVLRVVKRLWQGQLDRVRAIITASWHFVIGKVRLH